MSRQAEQRPAAGPTEGRRIEIRGTVQGVGMRPFVFRMAQATGVRGRVRNDVAGVTIEAFGVPAALEAFVARLHAERPPAAVYSDFRESAIPPEPADAFVIAESAPGGDRRVSIPADLATCEDCLAEVRDPGDRRYRYPFTNCTNCGPRFTIARDVPYDRQATTMAPFRMCPSCEKEYQTPEDRRFHAEPNGCPVCGPRLFWLGDAAQGGGDPIEAAGRALQAGRILAVKGIGGFHLACDATSPAAVRALRERKRRDEKPFAVMVGDLAAAEALAELTPAERTLLGSIERPIVLSRRRTGTQLAPEVAPDSPLIGLFLPYSPLHHLLLQAAGRPLVMTSGNLSEEPIAFRDGEALERLGGIADAILAHDREIETRADDSVARVIAGHPTIFRRSRGFVPRSIQMAPAFRRPVLACGALLKNTFCIGFNDEATLGPHIGDLENLETYGAFEDAIARMEHFLRVRPEVIAHDLHPDILSTRYARSRAGALGIPTVAVQHHHAHVAAGMAEHGLSGPVLGVAYDGTGYGSDGSSWGGEILLVWAHRFERIATLRPVALAGGDRAVKEPWRVALALLDDAFQGDPPLDRLPLFGQVRAKEIALVRRMIAEQLNAPLVHGAGRFFDAAAAIALGRGWVRHEAQAAMALEGAAASGDHGRYPFDLDQGLSPWQLDLRSTVRALAGDVAAGTSPGIVSARFHDTLADATAELVRRAARTHQDVLERPAPVVLTGGCFQNARLAEGILEALSTTHSLYVHGQVPPGDGGIALGQVLVANAQFG